MASGLTVKEASEAFQRSMRNVLRSGPGICDICRTFIARDYSVCWPCNQQPRRLDGVTPITYSEHLGQMHTALRNYKDGGSEEVERHFRIRLTAVLWRFIEAHEPCVARTAGVREFDAVAVVPSSVSESRTSLATIVGWCGPLKDRLTPLLRTTGEAPGGGRDYDERRYEATVSLEGSSVLLIDDTWTTGGHAQSAAHALKKRGARTVALVVIGRHVRPDYEAEGETNAARLAALPPFDWTTCSAE